MDRPDPMMDDPMAGGAPPPMMDDPMAGGAPPPMDDPMAGGAPPPGAATAEDVMAADQASAQERMAMIAAEAPTPEGTGIPSKVLDQVVHQINDVTAALNKVMGEEALPRVMWDAGSVKTWQSQIPPEIFLPVVALVGTAQQLGMNKHVFDPVKEFTTSGGARGVAAKLKKMAADTPFIEAAAAANAPGGAPPADAAAEPPPLSEEEQAAQDDTMLEAM